MGDLLGILKELVPVWLILLLVGFGYLIVLFKRASDRFIDLASQQAKFMQERVDVIDKSTGVFTRTIDQQEKEITKLHQQVDRLSSDQATARKTDAQLSAEELRLFSTTIERLSAGQELLFDVISRTSVSDRAADAIDTIRNQLSGAVDADIPKAIRARDLSAAVATLKSDLRNLVTAEEAYFADNVKYTGRIEDLSFQPSPGVRIVKLVTTTDGWFAVAAHQAAEVEYGITIGSQGEFWNQAEGVPFQIARS